MEDAKTMDFDFLRLHWLEAVDDDDMRCTFNKIRPTMGQNEKPIMG
jgi:hypothetical protein